MKVCFCDEFDCCMLNRFTLDTIPQLQKKKKTKVIQLSKEDIELKKINVRKPIFTIVF